MFKFVKSLYFVVVVVESSVTVVYPRSDQSSTGGLDDLTGLLCVERGLKFSPFGTRPRSLQRWLNQSCCMRTGICVTDVVVCKSFTLSSK